MAKHAYIEHTADGWPIDPSAATAAEGFAQLGYDLHKFTWADVVAGKYRTQFIRDNVFVGSYRAMRNLFGKAVAKHHPLPIDYPAAAQEYLRRDIIEADLDELRRLIQAGNGAPLFAKSIATKLFTGRKFRTQADLAYVDDLPGETPIWVSDVLPDIAAEWRVFVHRNTVVDARPYAGSCYLWQPPWEIAQVIASSWQEAPVAYTVDVCLYGNRAEAAVVEVNDFWAIDSYGMQPDLYALMLADRYKQIIDTGDSTQTQTQ